MKRKARVIAFYLPQYHPIPENDEWWGKGFTEWTNVGKAKPLFRGHYQPRVPADLGYYDLRLPIIREQQAEMAKEAGVEGFCYWHYWFGNGKTLLSEIFDDVLKSGKPDFPFCLGWANHSWSRKTWINDNKKDVDLMTQEYPGEEDFVNHFNNVLPAFKDKRYITVDGKPLFVIYEPLLIPNPKEFMDIWNKLAVQNGLKGIHFVGNAQGWESNFQAVLDSGYDALTSENKWVAQKKAMGYVRLMIKHKLTMWFPRFSPLDKFNYKDIIENWFTEFDKMENCYPSVIPGWDRSPRGGRKALIYINSTPELFKRHMTDALGIVRHKQPEHRIIFLKSWNEWAEGNYVEPDLKYGKGFLDAIKEVIVEG